jgi:putative colanic acid biosynthesis acetyltransferase WcaF
MKTVDLSKFSNNWYKPGNPIKRILWYIFNRVFLKSSLVLPSGIKVILLKFFGAKIGSGVIIKPTVSIKYPWFLEIGRNVWIGEGVWIDNLAKVTIGNNVCISQGASIFTGNHNYKNEAFNLMIEPVIIEEGVWVGAKAIICPGVILKNHSVLLVGSIAVHDTLPYAIYRGNPAVFLRERKIQG